MSIDFKNEKLDYQLKTLKAKEKHFKDLLEIKKKQEEIDQLEDKIANFFKEESYLTEKPDKEGIIKIRDLKYNRQMDKLKQELSECNNFTDKLTVRSKMLNLKMLKMQVKTTNASIKIGKGTVKISGIMSKIGDSLSEIGKIGEGFNPDQPKKQTKTKRTKKKKKKGKKSRKKSKKQTAPLTHDYGFNPEAFFK